MATAVGHYTAAAVTDRGRKRPSNEDAFGYSVEHGIYVVCDGMGGAAAGEIASSIAVDEMMKLLASGEAADHQPAAVEQAINAANSAIYTRAQRSNKLSGMGTTLVSLLTVERRAWMINVGDSRGYRLRGGHIDQITADHSLVEEQVRLGRMSRSEALRSPLRNVITRALGTQVAISADVFELDAEPGDIYLLCSDGLTRELTDIQIESALSVGGPLEETCANLVAAANEAGGHDNITCLLVRVDS